MFSTLTRYLFSYQSSTPSVASNTSDDMGRQQSEMQLPTPVQATGPISRKPSSFTLDRSRGPSHVAWLTPTSPSPSPSRRSWPPKPGTRASTPMSMGETNPAPAPGATSHQRALNRRSSESFHLQSLYYLSELILESESAAGPSQTRRLSSGGERTVEFPMTFRRPSTDSLPTTLGSARPSDGHPSVSATSPTTPSSKTAFVNRPLNRTISQSSASTFGTAASASAPATAPVIPPLDLRPNFSGSLGLTPRRSQLQPPSLPTVVASPRPQVSVIYEDSDIDLAESFRTAPSQRSSMFTPDLERGTVHMALDPFADPEDYRISTAAATEHTDRTDHSDVDGDAGYDDDEQSHAGLRHGIYHEIDLGIPEQSTSLFLSDPSLPTSPPWSPEASVLGTMPRRTSMDTDGTMVENAIKTRWRKGLSFGSYRTERRTWKPRAQYRFTSACILFWLGFVAPWCWLIGGWYLSRSGQIKPDGQFVHSIKWHWPRRRIILEKEISQKKRHMSLFWQTRHEERKNETKLMTPVQDNRSERSLRLPASKEFLHSYQFDPWVVRCRVAAVTSGIFLAVAVVIALVVIAGVLA